MKKIIAMYLPQFHEIKENNEWWEPGFTEWTNLKKAKPLFKNHNQPRIPLNNNYYNLLDNNVMLEQSIIAKKYNIYGWCFYHYWFEGKQLMEKPVNNFLKDKNIDIHFCLSWANHTWTKAPGKKDEKILLKQTYGNEQDWKSHFDYLINFFKDERYIKVDNKPMLVIYDVGNIYNFKEMQCYWDKLVKQEGFDGIYYVATLKHAKDLRFLDEGIVDAQFEYQPTFGLRPEKRIGYGLWHFFKSVFYREYLKKEAKFSYDLCWKTILKKSAIYYSKGTTYNGAFCDWDTTARWGKKGNLMIGVTPQKFKKYFKKQYYLNNEEYIFFTAWNEWSEGAYLEPDEKNKYSYLECIKEILDSDVNGKK